MMSKSGSCGRCAFFEGQDAAPSGPEGLCRFNPPVSQPTADTHGLWPVVTEKDWCGHFAPGPASATMAAE